MRYGYAGWWRRQSRARLGCRWARRWFFRWATPRGCRRFVWHIGFCWPWRWLSYWRGLHVENAPIFGAHEQHRGSPLQRAVVVQANRLTRFGHRRIHRQPFGQALIKPFGQQQRGRLADFILHGQHGWNAALHQRGCCAGKNIQVTPACPFTGVEDRQPQRPMIPQQPGQLRGG